MVGLPPGALTQAICTSRELKVLHGRSAYAEAPLVLFWCDLVELVFPTFRGKSRHELSTVMTTRWPFYSSQISRCVPSQMCGCWQKCIFCSTMFLIDKSRGSIWRNTQVSHPKWGQDETYASMVPTKNCYFLMLVALLRHLFLVMFQYIGILKKRGRVMFLPVLIKINSIAIMITQNIPVVSSNHFLVELSVL